MWAKYWAFTGMVKLGRFNPEAGTFTGRSKGQMAPFPELNREALALVIDVMVAKVNGRTLDDLADPALIETLKSSSFGKVYGRALKIVTKKTGLSSTDGKWIVYRQGSDPVPLVQSLKGMNTGWCTAGESTARSQLEAGDFHVFYSRDEKGEPRIPRIAIRMEGESIAEVRGIGEQQNLDSDIAATSVLPHKLKEFGTEGDAYAKKNEHMRLLTLIDKKHRDKQELSAEDLRFLYEVDEPISGFGYQQDPRIAEIKELRNVKQDLATVFKVKESEISTTRQEALSGGIKVHYGLLPLSHLTSADGLVLPRIVVGILTLDGLKSARGLKLPDSVNNLYMRNLQSAEGLVFPEKMGDLYLDGLTSAEGLVLPRTVQGVLELSSLTFARALKLPETVRNLHLSGLISAEGVVFPRTVRGALNLGSLKSASNLILPESVKDLDLSALTSADGITFPQTVHGFISLGSLKSAKNVDLPDSVAGPIVYRHQHISLSELRALTQ